MERELTPHQFRLFGFSSIDPDANEVVSGWNFDTFPTAHRWKDEQGYVWIRVGIDVFDFRTRHGEIPDGKIQLKKRIGRLQIILWCEVESAHMNIAETVGDGVALQNEDVVLSKVCGRATLKLLNYKLGTQEKPLSLTRSGK